MTTRAQKIRLSIFLLGSGSLLLITFLVLLGGRLLRRVDSYGIEYRDVSVSGLEAGAPVKYHGVQVGRVSDLSVKDAFTIAVRIEVRRGTPIRRDTQAVLAQAGITGQRFVELEGGTQEAGPLPPGGMIPAGRSFFDTLTGQAGDLMQKLEDVLTSVNALLNPETTARTQRLLAALGDVAEQSRGLLANLTVASARMDTTLEQVSIVAARFRTESDSMKLAQTLTEFRTLINNSNSMMLHGDLLLVQSRDRVLRSLVSMEEALENLREATGIIRDNPSVLIRGRQATGRDEFGGEGR